MIASPGDGFSLRSVGRSAAVLTGGTAAVQVVGIARELVLASRVGVSADLDALLIALVLPATLSSVLTSGTVTALVPAYLTARREGGSALAASFSGIVLTWVGLSGLLLAIALAAFSTTIVEITGPGLSEAGRLSAAGYLRILAPIAFTASISAILYAVCLAEERFTWLAWASFAGPATTLVVMLVTWDALSLGALALGSLLGPVVTAVFLLIATVRCSIVPRLGVRVTGTSIRTFLGHAAPLTAGGAILQLNVIGERAIASLVGPGVVSALRYAEVLIRVPIGTIGPAWGAAIYPALVRVRGRIDQAGLGAAAGRTIRYSAVIFVPFSVLTAAVAPIAVAVAYVRGAFDADGLALTAAGVAGFAPLILLLMISPVLTSAHNALQNGRVVLGAATLNVAVYLPLAVLLGSWFGVGGMALASSSASGVAAAFLAYRLARAEPSFQLRPVTRGITLAVLACLPAAGIAGVIAWSSAVSFDLVTGLLALGVVAIGGPITYLAVATRLGLEEPWMITRFVTRPIVTWIRSRSSAL